VILIDGGGTVELVDSADFEAIDRTVTARATPTAPPSSAARAITMTARLFVRVNARLIESLDNLLFGSRRASRSASDLFGLDGRPKPPHFSAYLF
jgi:hypothetical protein